MILFHIIADKNIFIIQMASIICISLQLILNRKWCKNLIKILTKWIAYTVQAENIFISSQQQHYTFVIYSFLYKCFVLFTFSFPWGCWQSFPCISHSLCISYLNICLKLNKNISQTFKLIIAIELLRDIHTVYCCGSFIWEMNYNEEKKLKEILFCL